MQPISELQELNTIRLAQDWTFAELAASMKSAGVPMSVRTLHYLLKSGDHEPLDRTVYKIRRYLEARKHATPPPTSRRKKGRAA